MDSYVVLLKGVNVGGKNIIRMADLKQWLLDAGFKQVQTYIQSGNIVLQSSLDAAKTKRKIGSLIKKQFELDIEVFVLSREQLQTALEQNPFSENLPSDKVFITFLHAIPAPELVTTLQTIDFGKEEYYIREALLYFYLPEGMAKSKMNNSFFEQKLRVSTTGRNINTVRKILALF